MFTDILKSRFAKFIIICYSFLLIWWIQIFVSGQQTGLGNYLFGTMYPFLALIGGINGLFISRTYGGWNSVMGRGIILLSLGLLGQVFGQFIWSYYNIIAQIEIPYPSLADLGYILVIPFNSLAMISFARAAGANFTIKTLTGSIQAFLVPAIMLLLAYVLFLSKNEVDFSNPIKALLDFGYPTGEAIYISLAILTYLLSKKFLGGIMRNKILFLIFAFVVQFITDYMFLYQVSQNLYYNAGLVDLMYASSFAIFSLALLNLKFIKIGE